MDKLSYHRHRYPSIVINVAALSLVAGLACWTPAESQTPAAPLPSVGAVIDETSASGISSGVTAADVLCDLCRGYDVGAGATLLKVLRQRLPEFARFTEDDTA